MTNKLIKKKTQKQKQKQKQTVIVNIHNEKAKPARQRRKPAGPLPQMKQTIVQPPPLYYPASFIPPPHAKEKSNNEVRDLLFRLGKEQQTTNAIMARTLAGTKLNPQHEIVLDKQEEAATLPNRLPRNMTENDAALLRKRAQLARDTPFVFSDVEEQTEDVHRIKNRMVAPQTPLNAFLGKLSEHQTPQMNQPAPTIHVEAGTSGTDAIGEVDLDTVEEETPAKGHAADAQYLLDFIDTLDKTRPPQYTGILSPPQRAPTLAEKAGLPVAESRFTSPEPPEAHASPAVQHAESEAPDRKLRTELGESGFNNFGEVKDAIQTWSRLNPEKKIQVSHSTRNGGSGGPKDAADFKQDLADRQLTFKQLREFSDRHSLVSPVVKSTRSAKVKQINKGDKVGGSPLG